MMTVLLFKNVSTFSSIKTRNVGFTDTPKGGVTQKQEKKYRSNLCLFVLLWYIFEDFWGIFLNGIDFTKMSWQQKFKSDLNFFLVKRNVHTHIGLWDDYRRCCPTSVIYNVFFF